MNDSKYDLIAQSVVRALAKQEDLCLAGHAALQLSQVRKDYTPQVWQLRYTKIMPRAETLKAIEVLLKQLQADLHVACSELSATVHKQQLKIVLDDCSITLQPDLIMRGTLLPITYLSCFEEQVPALAREELLAMLCYQALHRQWPEDFFAVWRCFDEVRSSQFTHQALVAYISCSPRPIHELLQPAWQDIKSSFYMDLEPILQHPCALKDLLDLREQLLDWLLQTMTDDDKQFLLSVKAGQPRYQLSAFKQLEILPAMQWKLMNIKKLHHEKQARILEKLTRIMAVSWSYN